VSLVLSKYKLRDDVRSNLYFKGILVFVSLYYLYFYSCSLSLYFIRAYVALLFFCINSLVVAIINTTFYSLICAVIPFVIIFNSYAPTIGI
jgi:hypothetical protein